MVTGFFRLLRRCFRLAAPFGRGKLAVALAVIFLNGAVQVVGVTSIFPFFALAADPSRIHNSRVGGWLLSHLPAMSQNELLVWTGLGSIFLLLLANATAMATDVIRIRYAHGLGHFLRTRLMTALSRRPYGYFLERNSGTLLQRVVLDVTQFIAGVFLPLMDVLSRVITLSLLLLTIFLVQPVIAIGAAVVLGGMYGIIFLVLHHRARNLGDRIKTANRGTMTAAQQYLGGIKPILVQEKSGYFIGEFERHSAVQARLYPWVPIFGNSPRYLIEPVAYGSLVGVVILLAAQGRTFSDILPNLTVMALAAYRMLPSVQYLYSQLSLINAMRYLVGEVEAELEGARLAPTNSDPAREGRAPAARLPFARAIRLENITFQYPGAAEPVLDNFSVEIGKNTSVGIAGTTGSGKSTLVDILLGLHSPQSGVMRVDERVIGPEDFAAWHGMIGYVPQDIYLLDATLAANIAFGIPAAEIDRGRLREAARAAQILDFIEQELPAKWETVVGERGVRLSGGQRQRVGIARALYHRPEILVLDEATSALDNATEAEVMKAINELHGQMTMVIVAHRLSTIKDCDAVLRLEKGRVNNLPAQTAGQQI